MMTYNTKLSDIQREWHLIDAKEKVLGRLSGQIAELLMGKNKTYFVRHLDCGDFVVVVNARQVVLTGRKEEKKIYYRHSGYPAGLKTEIAGHIREKKPERLIIHAVSGMLPQNKLKDRMLTRLYVFPGEEHPYTNKFKIKN